MILYQNMKISRLLGVAMLALGLASCANTDQVKGRITDSSTGAGIAGVPVTDGFKFTVTDSKGRFRILPDSGAVNVYYTLPEGYRPAVDTSGLPSFFCPVDRNVRGRQKVEFTLDPLGSPEKDFTLVMIGDPQCEDMKDIARWKSETLADISAYLAAGQKEGRFANPYAFTLGDIIFHYPDAWAPMRSSMSHLEAGGKPLPLYNCIGNHDHDYAPSVSSDSASVRNFIDNFGPVDYSMDRGDAHIVVMDNVIYTGNDARRANFKAGFSDAQVEWLKADLNLVRDREKKLLVFVCHIPLRHLVNSTEDGANFAEVMALMTDFAEAHIMTGHTHYPQNYIHKDYVCRGGQPVYEHVHGAACGAWWLCNLNADGSPSGYSVYTVNGAHISDWVAKSTGRSEDFQMRVYDGNQVYGEKYRYGWEKGGKFGKKVEIKGNPEFRDCFVVSLWNGDDAGNWNVELYVDGEKAGDFVQTSVPVSDVCTSAFFYNNCGKKTSTWCKASDHFWYIKAHCGRPSEEKNWEIRATQTIPGGGAVNVYRSSTLQTDYSGF